MLYMISISKTSDKRIVYVLFETKTESTFICDTESLKTLMLIKKLSIKNIMIVNGELKLKMWPNTISSTNLGVSSLISESDNHILLCKISEDQFKLISNKEKIHCMSGYALKKLIDENKVFNCTVADEEYKSIDTYEVIKDSKFEKHIAEQYEKHIALTSLLGFKMVFEYIIEGQEVKLKKYTGTSTHVIVPKFITSIMESAFSECKITDIKLNEGLTSIGGYTFEGCNISEVIIPETVEIICGAAFSENRKLINEDGSYKDTVKILGKRTKIIEKYYNVNY